MATRGPALMKRSTSPPKRRCHHCPELAVTTVTFDGDERPVCRIHEREHERRAGE